MKKIIALLLCVVMIVPAFAVNVFAGDGLYPIVVEVTAWKDLKYELSGEVVETEEGSYFSYYAYKAIASVCVYYNDSSWEYMTYEELQENFSGVYVATSQSAVSPWTECGTYSATLFVEDISCEFYLDIVEGEESIESFEVLTTKPLIKEYNGWWYTDHINGGEYFSYNAYYAIDTVEVIYDSGRTEIMDIETFNSVFDVTYGGPEAEEEKPSALNPWEAGTTHRLSASIDYTDIRCEFEVEIIENPVAAIEVVETRDLVENSEDNGSVYTYVNEDGSEFEFYEYHPSSAVKTIRVYFSDGTYGDYTWNQVDKLDDQFGLDLGYCVVREEYYQEPDNPWLVGNTYNATLEYAGRSADFQINIVPEGTEEPDEPDEPETPVTVTGISVSDTIPLEEYTGGGWEWSDESEDSYYKYNPAYAVNEIKIRYSDNSEVTVLSSELDYYDFTFSSNQSYDNQWKADSIYVATVEYEGFTCDFAVEILSEEAAAEEFAIVSFELTDIYTLTEYVDGYYEYYRDESGKEHRYFWYDPYDAVGTVYVTYANGTSAYKDLYELEDLWLEFEEQQSEDNPWGVGSYTAYLCSETQAVEFEIVIEDNGIESVELGPVNSIVENTHGFGTTEWSEEQGAYVEWFYYWSEEAVEYLTVTYTDGSVEEEPVYYFKYVAVDSQSPDTPWEVGNTYTVTLYILGEEFEYEVTIEENPIESIEVVQTIPLQENVDGYEDGEWDENDNFVPNGRFYYFEIYAVVSVKVNYNDGTSEIICINDDNRWDFATGSDQWESDGWTVGNTYTAVLDYMGRGCEYEIEIVPAGDFYYTVENGGINIWGLSESGYENTGSVLTVPDEIYGVPVNNVNNISDNAAGVETLVFMENIELIDENAVGGMSGLKTVILPESLTFIGESAFAYCDNIETVYYNGTEEQWNAIEIGDSNETLLDAEIICLGEEEVIAVIDGEITPVAVGTEMVFETEKLTYDPETGFGYVFAKWVTSGVEVEDENALSLSFEAPDGSFVVEKETFIHGDVSDDGKVNALDSAAVLKTLKKGEVTVYTDLNFDGKVNALDSAILLKIIKGKYYNA